MSSSFGGDLGRQSGDYTRAQSHVDYGKQQQGESWSKIPFYRLPAELQPSMLYVTPGSLVRSGVTRYSVQNITALIRQGVVPAWRVVNQYLIPREGVAKLLDWEQSRLEPGVPHPGLRPGQRQKEPD